MTEPAATADPLPAFLAPLVAQLRRRRIQVGIGDVHALRLALRAGFGLSSRDELRELCVALWAKSPAEAQVVRAAFANLDGLTDWTVTDAAGPATSPPGDRGSAVEGAEAEDAADARREAPEPEPERAAEAGAVRELSPGPAPGLDALRTGASGRGLVLVPQYPLTSREVAQAWRHLRRPVRSGPAVELDIGATITERSRRGAATPPVLVPRRRNAVRLLMLTDRHGSMTPFHGYADHVIDAIRSAGRIDDVRVAYFHDLPGTLADKSALQAMPDPFRPDLDPVLGRIGSLRGGRVYDDPGLTVPRSLDAILAGLTGHTAALVISDAGAARRQFDIVRVLDTVGLLKALRAEASGVAWLNPVPADRWQRTTAAQVARYVPMYPFSRQGLYQAVDALRGRPVTARQPS
jgi:uncharacterized protein with von Willebrand factor type A (vWA) domain